MVNKYLASSVDPASLSATVSGIILGCSALIIFFAGRMGYVIGDAQISQIATSFGLAVGSLWTIFGVIRKIVVKSTAPKV